jgi:hypothetical protein
MVDEGRRIVEEGEAHASLAMMRLGDLQPELAPLAEAYALTTYARA